MSAAVLMMKRSALVLAVGALTVLGGCSLFSSSKAPKPAPLEQITPEIKPQLLWSQRIDNTTFAQTITARGDKFFIAAGDGSVLALQASTGQTVWRADVGAKLSAGVGSDGRYAAVVTRNNELVVIDAGKVTWRKALPTPVIAAPFVAGERVFVLTVDRQVLTYDAQDGRKIFDMRRPGEPLTLAKAGVIGSFMDTLVVGQGSRLAGVDPLRGTVRWEASVANPRGTNEVERLADLVAPLVRNGEVLCARAFQSAVGCVSAERGATIWSRNVGGVNGVGGDAEYIYGADASDRLSAWRIASGDTAWTAEQFTNRKLGVPLAVGNSVMVGDFEGYLHFVARDSGKTLARMETDGSPIVTAPVLLDGIALVATSKGGLYAIKPQ